MIKFLKALFHKEEPKVKAPLGTCGRCAFFTGYKCDNGPEQGHKKEASSEGCKWWVGVE